MGHQLRGDVAGHPNYPSPRPKTITASMSHSIRNIIMKMLILSALVNIYEKKILI